MVQATKDLTPLADALRDVVIAARRRAHDDDQDRAAVALLAQLLSLGPLRASDLAERACLDPSTVSRHIQSLEAAGYLARQPDPDDGRATFVEVSRAGRDLVSQVRRQRVALLEAALHDWSAKDVESLIGLTRRLADDMDKEPQQ